MSDPIAAMATLISFVWWQPSRQLQGGYTREEALEALGHILGFTPEQLARIANPQEDH